MPAQSAQSALPALRAAGFVVGDEDLALDLADTLVTATDPATDLLEGRHERWWAAEQHRLPRGWETPGLQATRALRDATREALECAMAARPVPAASLDLLNAAAASATRRQVLVADLRVAEQWHAEDPRDLALTAVARAAIALLGVPDRVRRLRRCAGEHCSMLFEATHARRQWCTPDLCGNRARVARHAARRSTSSPTPTPSPSTDRDR